MELEKMCLRCKEMWPPDGEFYRPGKNKCRACEYEIKNAAPPRTKEARKSESKRKNNALV
jgi:hypothetical protein